MWLLDKTFDDDPEYYIASMKILCVFGTIVNLVSLLCVLDKSTTMASRIYARLMALHIVLALFNHWCFTIGTIPVIMIPYVGGFTAGYLADLNVSTNYQMVLQATLLIASLCSIVALFYYRCYCLLPHNHLLRKFLIKTALYTVLVIVPFLVPPIILNAVRNQLNIKQYYVETYGLVSKKLWDPNTVVFLITTDDIYIMFCVAILVLAVIAFSVVILFLAYYSFRLLNRERSKMSTKTMKLHKTFTISLICQVSVHMAGFILPGILTVSMALAHFPYQGLVNMSVFWVAACATCEGIVMISVNRNHRKVIWKWILRALGRGKSISYASTYVTSVAPRRLSKLFQVP